MTPEEWFAAFTAALPSSGPTVPQAEERQALLDLARVAAHASERWAAPVTTYLAGLALAATEPDDRVAVLRRLVATFDLDDDTGGQAG